MFWALPVKLWAYVHFLPLRALELLVGGKGISPGSYVALGRLCDMETTHEGNDSVRKLLNL